MNPKHRKTLNAIFSTPAPRTLPFRDIENLLCAIGCKVVNKPGSAVGFVKDGKNVGFHRPHPGNEAKPYQVKAARGFLKSIGVEP